MIIDTLKKYSSEKSLQLGKLKIFHIKFLWERKVLKYEADKSNEHLLNQLDYFVLDGLNIPIEKVISYLYTKRPDFSEFEDWVLSWHDGFIFPELVKKINDTVTDFINNGQQNYPSKTISDDPIFSGEEIEFWNKNGYIVLKNAIDKKECKELELAIWNHLELSPNEPQNWDKSKDRFWLKDFEHPLLSKNRNSKNIYRAFKQLWGTDKLFTAIDRISFNPPLDEKIKDYGPNNIHWDISLSQPVPFDIFGMLYLNDIKEEQGAFQCIPGFQNKIHTWLDSLDENTNPRDEILQDKYKLDISKISAKAGDFILCNQSLPHSSSLNRGDYPRFVHYMDMYPPNRYINPVWK